MSAIKSGPGATATDFYDLVGRQQMDLEHEKKAHGRTFKVLHLLKEGEISLDDLVLTKNSWELKPNGQE